MTNANEFARTFLCTLLKTVQEELSTSLTPRIPAQTANERKQGSSRVKITGDMMRLMSEKKQSIEILPKIL